LIPSRRVNQDLDDVARYFDANTSSFTKTGQGGASIRRAIWAPGVTAREDAFRVVDRAVLAEVQRRPGTPRVVDLGCGVGSSLLWLRARAELDGVGVTLSGEQARLAREAFAKAPGLRCVHGSFTELPADLADVDVAFAIEAFVLSPSVEAFVAPIAARLRPGGTLLVCDDFLGPNAEAHPWLLADFREGWLASALVTPAALVEVAARHGLSLSRNEDLTPHLELGRPRDRLLSLVVALGRPFFSRNWLFRSWVGGSALQAALARRAIEHRLLVFERT
jgi:cyclopropane fatty-acyl-phospholipid synthase-like methyltransferase